VHKLYSNVDVGWERSEPNELVYNKYLFPKSMAGCNSHEVNLLDNGARKKVPSDQNNLHEYQELIDIHCMYYITLSFIT
jgi:hypothetical protein